MSFLFCTFLLALYVISTNAAIQTTTNNFWGVEAVTINEEIVEFNPSGYANAKWEIEHSADSGITIGSNTKLFSSVMLFQMEEKGMISSLSDSIDDYLDVNDLVALGYDFETQPEGIDNNTYCPRLLGSDTCERISFLDLMAMNSGIIKVIGCGYDPTDPEQAQWMEYCWDFCGDLWVPYKGSINYYIADFINLPLSFTPGIYNENTTTEYSNPNYMFMQFFIEKLSGMSYGEYLKTYITEPLGMDDTYYDPFEDTNGLSANRADPVILINDGDDGEGVLDVATCVDLTLGIAAASGGMVSTNEDMHLWYRTLFNKTEGYIPPIFQNEDTVRRLMTPLITTPLFLGLSFTPGSVLVQWDTATQDWPVQLTFSGGTACSSTWIGAVWNPDDDMVVVTMFDMGLYFDKTAIAGYDGVTDAGREVVSVNGVDYGICNLREIGAFPGTIHVPDFFAKLAEYQQGAVASESPSKAPTQGPTQGPISSESTTANVADDEAEVKDCDDEDDGDAWLPVAVIFIVLFLITLFALVFVLCKSRNKKFVSTSGTNGDEEM